MKLLYLNLTLEQTRRLAETSRAKNWGPERWAYVQLKAAAGQWTETIERLYTKGTIRQTVAKRLRQPGEDAVPLDECAVIDHDVDELERSFLPGVKPTEDPVEGAFPVRVTDKMWDRLWKCVALSNMWYSFLQENKAPGTEDMPVYRAFEDWATEIVVDKLVSTRAKALLEDKDLEEEELYPGLHNQLNPPSNPTTSKTERRIERVKEIARRGRTGGMPAGA